MHGEKSEIADFIIKVVISIIGYLLPNFISAAKQTTSSIENTPIQLRKIKCNFIWKSVVFLVFLVNGDFCVLFLEQLWTAADYLFDSLQVTK